ncbi:NAD(P)H-dependent oxidoreductase [Amycolatopsis nigrescens]|uniref:NAD(P)H-dependent oxidoreductase n=1 Tax=Amycolatopsis nigrescens TaxID=381445 RepID=UPI000382EDEE|nr:Gfo/Idh/MocA family oxidoreductase [Amycolatopsis nigrescens]
MNLWQGLAARERPVRCAVIGCGKFATMFLSQASRLEKLEVVAVADLSADRAAAALAQAGHPPVKVTEDPHELFGDARIEVIVEATGSPLAGTEHALAAIDAGQHVVMVTVEADVLVGPLLAERARRAGVVYSMAYGDQPALICELVDWARTTGFDVVAAGKGTKYLPEYHYSTPDTVWSHYGFTAEYAAESGLNPRMFNSFLDGTKSAIEMAAVANATGLSAPDDGLTFPPCGADDLASVCVPTEHGGALDGSGVVEVVSSLHRDGTDVPRDLRWGVYVTLEAHSRYVQDCFAQYGLATDRSGRFTAMYRPYHLIGLELGVSVLAAALRGEPTGAPAGFTADVVTVAKRDLAPGDQLDGEGGYTVFGSVLPAARSLAGGLLPIGLAHGATVTSKVQKGQPVRWADVRFESESTAMRLRRELETTG